MTNLITIKKFHLLGEDNRGTTAEFCLPRAQNAYIFLTRKAGTLSGNTYHTGKSQATNPKIFILLSGTIVFSYRKVATTTPFREEIQGPVLIEVPPLITHNIETLTDCLFLECNSIADIQADRIREMV